MPNIDVSAIEGYESMTPEEKVAALEVFEYSDGADEIEKYRKLMQKANSEAAAYKKQLQGAMTDEQKKTKEAEEQLASLQTQIAELREEKILSENKAKFIALGYDETLASETAQALKEGNMDKVFENQKKFLEKTKQDITADLLKGTPKPPAGSGGSTMTLEAFRKLSSSERLKFSIEHPEEYKALYGGN